MNTRVLLLLLTSVASNFVRRNFIMHSYIGPHSEAWIGSSAFAAGIAMYFASYVINPHQDNAPLALLYTYYTAVSLLVSILVLKLVWIPVVELVTEINLILSKTMLYMNRILWPNMGSTLMKDVGVFFGTKAAVIWSTNLLGILLLYSVSTDVLNYMALYFYTLPKKGMFARMRSVAIKAINSMLYALNSKKHVRFNWEADVKYYASNVNPENVIECMNDDDDII